jgi:hypothetical protein
MRLSLVNLSGEQILHLAYMKVGNQKVMRVGANSPHALTNSLNQRFTTRLETA